MLQCGLRSLKNNKNLMMQCPTSHIRQAWLRRTSNQTHRPESRIRSSCLCHGMRYRTKGCPQRWKKGKICAGADHRTGVCVCGRAADHKLLDKSDACGCRRRIKQTAENISSPSPALWCTPIQNTPIQNLPTRDTILIMMGIKELRKKSMSARGTASGIAVMIVLEAALTCRILPCCRQD